jgi:hypothetical protein
MNFDREKERMVRILKACGAPAEIVDQFEDICRYRDDGSVTTAEELLLDVCRQQNFTAPWEDGGSVEFYRPLGNPAECEQSYRRGYYHGMKRVLDDLAKNMPLEDIKAFAVKIDAWRREGPLQQKFAGLGRLRPAGLPPKWDNI